jgi:hypothetical protein
MQLNTSPRRLPIGKRRLYWNRPWAKAIAVLPRQGRIIRQCRRCLTAHNGFARMRELREWCYPGRQRQHWHHNNIRRALERLSAKRIGWGMYAIS